MDDPARKRPLSGDDASPIPAGLHSTIQARLHSPIPAGLDATLVLLRHGESQFIVEGRFQGQAETPLSDAGVRQAELAGVRLARPHDPPALPIPTGPPLETVHSPLARAAQTAEAVTAAMARPGGFGQGVALRPDPGFLEIGQGDWESLHRSEIEERYGAQLAAWRRDPLTAWAPGGESLPEVQARVRPALAELLGRLAAAGAPGTLDRPQVAGYREVTPDHPWSVLVAHDGVFKVVLLTLFDLPLERFWMWLFDLCGISVVEFRGGRAVARAHNLTEHLSPLLDERSQQVSEERERSGAL